MEIYYALLWLFVIVLITNFKMIINDFKGGIAWSTLQILFALPFVFVFLELARWPL